MSLIDSGRPEIYGFEYKKDNQSINIGGFTAGVRIEESIVLESDVPDSPLENGSVASDHIINKPVVISIAGVIGDIDLKPQPEFDANIRANQNLGAVSVLVPDRTQTQLSKLNAQFSTVYDIKQRVDGLAKAGEQIFRIFSPDPSQSAADQFFQAINQLRAEKELVDIETSYGVYKNMAIISTSFPRALGESKELPYSIRAKQITFAETIFSEVKELKKNPGTGLNGQSDDLTDKGVNAGKDVPESLLSKIGGIF